MVAFSAWVRTFTFHRKATIYKRCKTKKWYLGPFYLQKLYLPSILHLTLTHCNSLVTSALLSVRYYKIHLHATYTPAHTATRHKHGRAISQHRGAEKSVAPTESPTSLWRIIHRIRPNRLGSSGVWCVRCMQGCVWYFELILHTWKLCVSTRYTQKV